MFVKNFFVGLVCFFLPILFMANTYTSVSAAETPLLLEVAEAKDKKESTPEEEEEEDDC